MVLGAFKLTYLRKRNNGIYYACWKEKRINGMWYTMSKTLKTKNRTLAQRRFNISFPDGFGDVRECYVDEWMLKYEESLSVQQLDPKTLDKYIVQAETFINFFKGRVRKISEFRHEHIIEFQNHLRQKKYSLSTLAGYGRGLKKMFNVAESSEYLRKNPMAKVKVGRMEQRQRFFKPTEIIKIIEIAQKDVYSLALVLFFLQTGFRIQEVVDSRWENLNQTSRTITVVGKGKKRRFQKIPALTFEAIMRLKSKWPTIFGKSQKQLFRYIKDILNKAEVQGSPHTFRDTYATYSIRIMPPDTLRNRMGHASLIQTDKYTHAMNGDVPVEVMKYFEDWKTDN